MRKFRTGFILLLMLGGLLSCAARKFQTLDEYSNWTLSYYQKPQPSRLVESLDFYVHSPLFTNARTRGPAVYFFAEALRAKSGMEPAVLALAERLDKDEQKFFCFTVLWLVNTEASLNLVRDYVKAGKESRLRNDVESLLYEHPGDPLESPVVTAADIDVLWAIFYATGDESYIQKLIFVVGNGESGKEMNDFLLGVAARKSLIEFGREQSRVLAILEQEATFQPEDEKNFLREIVREVKEPRP